MNKKIPIYQMLSFSRSGETLMLRTLAAHPKMEIVHQLFEPDVPEDLRLFRHLKSSEREYIDASHPLLEHRQIRSGSRLLLKNAVWIPKKKPKGFILIRNPFSVMLSAYVARKEPPVSYANHKEQCRRWGKGIDSNLLPHILSVDNLEAFCILYTRKMVNAFYTGLPIVRYEEFVSEPDVWARKIIQSFGLKWDERVHNAHLIYSDNQYGHGRIALWKPIHNDSTEKYKTLPKEILDRIYALTAPIFELFGYTFESNSLQLKNIDYRF